MDDFGDLTFEFDLPFDDLERKLKALQTKLGEAQEKLTAKASKFTAKATERFKKFRSESEENSKSIAEFGKSAKEKFTALAAGILGSLTAITLLAAGIEGKAKKSVDSLKQSGDNLLYGLQLILSESGAITVVLKPIQEGVDRLRAIIIENNAEIQKWLLDGIIATTSALRAMLPVIVFGAKSIYGIKSAFVIAGQALSVGIAAVWSFSEALAEGLIVTAAAALESLSSLTGSLGEVAEAAGMDSVAEKLGAARKALKGWQQDAEAAARNAASARGEANATLDATLTDLAATAEKEGMAMEALGDGITNVLAPALTKIEEGARKAKTEVRDLSKEMSRKRPKKSEPEFEAEQLHLLQLQRMIVDAQATGNREAERQLTLSLAIKQAELARAKEKNKALGAAQEELAIAQARLAAEQQRQALAAEQRQVELAAQLNGYSLAILEAQHKQNLAAQALLTKQRALAEASAAYAESEKTAADLSSLRLAQKEAELEYEQQLRDIRAMALETEMARYAAAADLFQSSLGIHSDPAVSALATIGGSVDDLIAKYHELRAAGMSAEQAMSAAASSAAGVVGATIAQQIKDTRKAAAVRGAFAAAEAILHYASGNIPSGVAATAASVAHFAVAGTAGRKGGGGAASGGGSGAASGSVAGGGATSEQAQAAARVLAEAINRSQSQRGIVINYNLSNNTLLQDTPTTQRALADAAMADLERRGIVLGRGL